MVNSSSRFTILSAWTQKDDKTSVGSSGTSDADEQKQRAALGLVYGNGAHPLLQTPMHPLLVKTAKNGRAVFAVAG